MTDNAKPAVSGTVRGEVRHRVRVPRFWLQPTITFQGGPPQREEYLDDTAFEAACEVYAQEWRLRYICGDHNCQNRDCPQHWPNKPLS